MYNPQTNSYSNEKSFVAEVQAEELFDFTSHHLVMVEDPSLYLPIHDGPSFKSSVEYLLNSYKHHCSPALLQQSQNASLNSLTSSQSFAGEALKVEVDTKRYYQLEDLKPQLVLQFVKGRDYALFK